MDTDLVDESDPDRGGAKVLLALAAQAYELAVEVVKQRRASEVPDPARLPGTQFAVARMRGSLATMTAVLDRSADSTLARYFLAGEAVQVVSTAYDVIGAGDERIAEIWRDLKADKDYSADLARELIGKAALGIDPDEKPRWL